MNSIKMFVVPRHHKYISIEVGTGRCRLLKKKHGKLKKY